MSQMLHRDKVEIFKFKSSGLGAAIIEARHVSPVVLFFRGR